MGTGFKLKAVRGFVIFAVFTLVSPLVSEIKSVEYKRDVYYNSDPQAGVPLDISFHTPASWFSMSTLPNHQQRLYVNFVAGMTPYTLKGGVRFKFIWDTDSVSPGGSFVVKVVAVTDSTYEGNPYTGGSYEIYSAYGLQAGMTVEDRALEWTFSPAPSFRWGEWVETPIGIGIDGCLNIKADGILPMFGDSLIGGDQLSIVSVGADIFAGGKQLKDAHGNPIPKVSQSDVLGLLNIADAGMTIDYKLQDGIIYARIEAGWPFELDTTYHDRDWFRWIHRGDTVNLHLRVDPLASNNDTGYIFIRDGYVREEIYYRRKCYVSVLNRYSQTFLEESWSPVRNGYEDLTWYQNFPDVRIPITGQSLAHVDLYIDPGYLSMWHTVQVGNYTSFVEVPEVGGITGVGLKVRNKGNIASHGYVIKWIFPDTTYVEDRTGFVSIPPGGHDDVSQAGPPWTHDGEMNITVVIIPDTSEHDPNPHNDTLNLRVHVSKRKITTLIAVIDPVSGDTITPSDSIYDEVYAYPRYYYPNSRAVPDTTYNHWDRWFVRLPEDARVNISAEPSDSHPELIRTSKYVEMDTVSTDPFFVYLTMLGNSSVEGTVTFENGAPAESVQVTIGSLYSAYTDSSGYYRITNVPANSGLSSPYYIRFYLPGYRVDSLPLTLTAWQTHEINHQLTNIDTVPPYGTLNISSVIRKNTTLNFTALDTFTQWGDTLPPEKVFVRDGNSDWSSFDYGTSYNLSIDWTMHTRTSHNEVDTIWVKFVDLAGNESDSSFYVVTVDQDGPQGTFTINHGDSLTENPEIRITDVSISSSIVPVTSIQIREDGGRVVTYPYTPGAEYSYMLNGTAGTHNVHVCFIDSLGVVSQEVSQSILLDYYGAIYINDDSTFTNSSTVNIKIDAIGILASNASGNQNFSGYPFAQSFVPHSDRISSISVCLVADSGSKIGIATLVDSSGDSAPGEFLVLDTLRESVNGWKRIDYPEPISVYPDSIYMIVIFKDSLQENTNNIELTVGSDNNYAEGHLYYSPCKKGLFWYETGYDMLFRVMGKPDSMQISNNPQFYGGTGWIPYQMNYSDWNLSPGEGLRTVYVQVKMNGETRTYHDAINVDTTPPDTAFAILMNNAQFLETTECTLKLYAWDGGSGVESYKINDSSWYPMPTDNPFITTFNVDSGAPGPRDINVVFRDRAGNEYHVPTITIDYDPSGPQGRLILANNGYSCSETVNVYIDLDKVNGKAITVDSMRFSTDGRDWTDWEGFSTTSQFVFDRVGPVVLYAGLKDNYGKRSIIFGSCLIDTTPPYTPVIHDQGDITASHDSLSFWWTCYGDFESGIDHFDIYISRDSLVRSGYVIFTVSGDARSAWVGPMTLRGDSTYYAIIKAYNRVGLVSVSSPTDGIRILNGIQPFHLISPSDSSVLSSGDTVNFIWHATTDILSGISEYRVFLDQSLVAQVTDTTWQATGLDEGWHTWYVEAVDSLLDHRRSDTAHFYIGTLNPPPAPVAISPHDTVINTDTVRFVWSPGQKRDSHTLLERYEMSLLSSRSKKGFQSSSKSIRYVLEVSSDSAFSVLLDSVETPDTEAVLTFNEGHYWWRVMALDFSGSSSWSDSLNFTVDTSSPSVPVPISPVSGDTVNSFDVTFIWRTSTDSVTGILRYQLTCYGDTSFVEVLTDTSFSVTLRNGNYNWFVSAVDSGGNQASSDTESFTVFVATLPVPEPFYPPDDTIIGSISNISFAWRPGSRHILFGKTNRLFEVRFSSDSLFTSTNLVDTVADTTVTEDLWEGSVFWQVREIDTAGHISLWSQTMRVVLDVTPPSCPFLQSPHDSSFFDTNSVHFVWGRSYDENGIDHYLLQCELVQGDSTVSFEYATQDTEYTVNNLQNGFWRWGVYAFDPAGNSDYAGYRVFHVSYTPPPPAPILVEPVGNSWAGNPVVFRWRIDTTKRIIAQDKQYQFNIEIMRNDSVIYYTTVSEDSTYAYLSNGEYTWHVRSFLNGRYSEWSSPDSFRVDTEAPSAPIPVYPGYGYYLTQLPVDFVWYSVIDSLSGIMGYRLKVANNPDLMNPVIDTLVSDTVYQAWEVYQGHWYWTVGAVDSAGNLNYCEIQEFELDTTTLPPVNLIFPTDSLIMSHWYPLDFFWHPLETKEIFYELVLVHGTDTLFFPELTDTFLYTDTLFPQGWYNWWIIAYNEYGRQTSSDTWAFCIDTTAPQIDSTTIIHDTSYRGPFRIRTFVVDEHGVLSVTLFYAFNSRDVDSVDMEADSVPNFYVAEIPEAPDTMTDTIRVIYFIRAMDDVYGPNEAYDPEDSAYTFRIIPVGINEVIPERFRLTGFGPNPVNRGMISISLDIPHSAMVKITLFGVDGRKVMERKVFLEEGKRRVSIKTPESSGLYFLRVNYEKFSEMQKIIVVR